MYFYFYLNNFRYHMKNHSRFFLLACLILLALSKSEYRVTNAQKEKSSVTLSLSYTGKDDYYGN